MKYYELKEKTATQKLGKFSVTSTLSEQEHVVFCQIAKLHNQSKGSLARRILIEWLKGQEIKQ